MAPVYRYAARVTPEGDRWPFAWLALPDLPDVKVRLDALVIPGAGEGRVVESNVEGRVEAGPVLRLSAGEIVFDIGARLVGEGIRAQARVAFWHPRADAGLARFSAPVTLVLGPPRERDVPPPNRKIWTHFACDPDGWVFDWIADHPREDLKPRVAKLYIGDEVVKVLDQAGSTRSAAPDHGPNACRYVPNGDALVDLPGALAAAIERGEELRVDGWGASFDGCREGVDYVVLARPGGWLSLPKRGSRFYRAPVRR
jgi:hypothetical protein